MKIIKPILIRLLIVAVPLLALYFDAVIGRQSENSYVGYGSAYLLIIILTALLIGFLIDLIIKRKQYKIVWIDVCFLLLFLISLIGLFLLF